MTLRFAHRGGLDGGAPPNTRAAFVDAVARGCDVESDVRLSLDGDPVLVHDAIRGVVVPRLWRTSWLRRCGVVPLAEVFDVLGSRELSLDVKEPAAVAQVLAALPPDRSRVWLVHSSLDVLARIRSLDGSVRLVHEAPVRRIDPASHARDLTARGIDAQNTHWSDWSPALRTAAAEAGVLAFGSIANTAADLETAATKGLDAIYSDHLELMLAAFP
ncbi:MAG: putative phosphodiesterase [Frankiales bacterium]|nr:putative phosphodiesterase [Frankiales bacterium]